METRFLHVFPTGNMVSVCSRFMSDPTGLDLLGVLEILGILGIAKALRAVDPQTMEQPCGRGPWPILGGVEGALDETVTFDCGTFRPYRNSCRRPHLSLSHIVCGIFRRRTQRREGGFTNRM